MSRSSSFLKQVYKFKARHCCRVFLPSCKLSSPTDTFTISHHALLAIFVYT